MNKKLKKLITNWRIIFLAILLLMAVVAINPNLNPEGVAITHVTANSSANLAGLGSPKQTAQPRDREVITAILGKDIVTMDDYYSSLNDISILKPGNPVIITTNEKSYQLILKPLIEVETTAELETFLVNVTEEVLNETSGEYENITVEKEVTRNKTIENVVGIEDIGLQVKEAPFSNIRKGLDLEGGTRVLLKPAENISNDDFVSLV